MSQLHTPQAPHFLGKSKNVMTREICTDSFILVEQSRFHTLADHEFSELNTALHHQFHQQNYDKMWDTLHSMRRLKPEHALDPAQHTRLKVKALTPLMLDAIKSGDERAVQALQQAFPEFDLVELQYKDPAATPESLRDYATRLKQDKIAQRFAIHVRNTTLLATYQE